MEGVLPTLRWKVAIFMASSVATLLVLNVHDGEGISQYTTWHVKPHITKTRLGAPMRFSIWSQDGRVLQFPAHSGDLKAYKVNQKEQHSESSVSPFITAVLPVLLPLIGALAWAKRWASSKSAPMVMAVVAGGPDHQDTEALKKLNVTAKTSTNGESARSDAPSRPPQTTAGSLQHVDGVSAKEYATHYAQNVAQFMVPVSMQDNVPVISLVEMFRHGAVDIPLDRIHATTFSDFFTGGFQDMTGVPVFVLLHRYVKLSPIYKLCIGPRSVVVISDALAVKHVLRSEVGKYDKGILAEVLQPIMGKGLIPADTITWIARRRAITPAFHQKWLNDQMALYSTVASRLVDFLNARPGEVIDMQERFCSASLDIIGKAVFNYEFGSITRESPVIQAVYAVMHEAERRASSIVPYWMLPNGAVEFEKHMKVLDDVLTALVEQCISQFSDAEPDESDPKAANNSLLRFLVEARGQDVTTQQLRDDLMTMLIAGHETTAATLNWALHELSQPENKALLQQVRQEIDTVLGDRDILTLDDVKQMPLVRYCLVEALRLYPAPPLLIRRCLKEDHFQAVGEAFKDGITIHPGQDVMLATWSMHRDKRIWGEDAEKYNPLRYYSAVRGSPEYQAAGWGGYDPARVRGLYPDETAADFGFVPFGGGGRKCVGDQFAMLESAVLLSRMLREFNFEATDTVTLGMGATIFAKEGLMMRATKRSVSERTKAPSQGIATESPIGQCPAIA